MITLKGNENNFCNECGCLPGKFAISVKKKSKNITNYSDYEKEDIFEKIVIFTFDKLENLIFCKELICIKCSTNYLENLVDRFYEYHLYDTMNFKYKDKINKSKKRILITNGNEIEYLKKKLIITNFMKNYCNEEYYLMLEDIKYLFCPMFIEI